MYGSLYNGKWKLFLLQIHLSILPLFYCLVLKMSENCEERKIPRLHPQLSFFVHNPSIHFTVMEVYRNQKIFTFKELKTENFDLFSSSQNNELIIKMILIVNNESFNRCSQLQIKSNCGT